MRDYKFKGKRIDNGEWVYGNLVTYISGAMQILIIGTNDLFVDVIPETVGQYTGLKDKNGKEIFEGDVINWSVRLRDKATSEIIRLRKRCVVEWRKAKASFTLRSFSIPNGMEAMYMGDYEIIGNICDNPELLEVIKNEV